MQNDKKLLMYKSNLPKLDLVDFLSGKISGYGIIQSRSGIVKRRFEFLANCNWNDGVCLLDEEMKYDDGVVDKRVWTINKDGESYIATTQDVIDCAKIKISGNAMFWSYKINIPYKNKKTSISCDDWMYLIDNKRLINKNIFKKFGFRVGELTLFMERNISSSLS